MGNKSYIDIPRGIWPAQGVLLDAAVAVIFHGDTDTEYLGTVVRYDITEPHLTLIKLDNGKHVLGTECQFRELT